MKITTLLTLGLTSLATAQVTANPEDNAPSSTLTDAFTADQGRCPPNWDCNAKTATNDGNAAPQATLIPIPVNPNTIKVAPTIMPCPEGRTCDGPILTTRPTTSKLAWPTGHFHHPPGGWHSAPPPSTPSLAAQVANPIINKEPSRLTPPVQDFEESLPHLPGSAPPPSQQKQPGSEDYPAPDPTTLNNRPEDPHHVNNLDGRSPENEDHGIPRWSSYFNAPKPVVPTGQPTIPPWERSTFFEAPRPGPTNLPAEKRDEEVGIPPWSSYFNAPKPVVPTGQPTIPPWARSTFFEAPRPTKRAVAATVSFITVTRTVDAEPVVETSE